MSAPHAPARPPTAEQPDAAPQRTAAAGTGTDNARPAADSAARGALDGPPDGADPTAPGGPPATPSDGASTRRLVTVVALAVALLAGLTGAGWAMHRHREATATAALAHAESVLADARLELDAARAAGRDILARSAERVPDNAVRVDLAALLVGLPPTEVDPAAGRAERTAAALERADAASERAEALVTATAAVRSAWDAWELDRATAAYTGAVAGLAVAVDESAALLAGSEGRVDDDAVRAALSTALDEAAALRGEPAPEGTAALDGAAAVVEEHVHRLAATRSEVLAAQDRWQAEQDRLAAERAAAARASSGGSRPAASGRTSGGGRTAGGGSSGGTSSGGRYDGWLSGWRPGDPVPDGWTVVVETEGGGWGGDEFGNVWTD